MKQSLKVGVSILLSITLFGCSTNPQPMESIEADKIAQIEADGLQDFDLYFLRKHSEHKNQIYSPLSMKYALSMLSVGAKGQTKEEIDAVLGNFKPKMVNNSDHCSMSNALFVNKAYKGKIKTRYEDTLKSKYNAEILYDAFQSP